VTSRWRQFLVPWLLAAAAFIFVHEYQSDCGVIWNLINGEIYLNEPCVQQTGPFAHYVRDLQPANCPTPIPFKWVLAAAILATATQLISEQRRRLDPKVPPPPPL
jgi:hypothetical protein